MMLEVNQSLSINKHFEEASYYDKKIIGILIVITLICTIVFSQVTFAEDNNELSEVTKFDVEKPEIDKAAAAFLLSDIVNNNDSQWDNSCKISIVTPLFDLDNIVTAYSCQVVKELEYKGYIIVSASSDLFPIIQFSYTSKSPSETLKNSVENDSDSSVDKVYYTGGFNYFVEVKDKNNDMNCKLITGDKIKKGDIKRQIKVNKKKVAKNRNIWESLKQIDRNMVNELFVAGVSQPSSNGAENNYAGVITNPTSYLKNRFGQSNTYTVNNSRTKKLDYVGNWLMQDYESTNGVNVAGAQVNNCTLSSLANILIYWSINGCTKVPLDKVAIYSKVRTEAVKLGYNPTDGISVTKNNNLVTNVWAAFGYTNGSGTDDYGWGGQSSMFDKFITEINAGRPVIFSLASRPYYNHTIAVRGYTSYVLSGVGSYDFLVVHDNWNSGDCYISDQEGYFGCMTRITPPSPK